MRIRITVLPGDGVGPEVIAEAVKVMEAVTARFGHEIELREGMIGGNAIDALGTPFPEDTEAMCQDTDGILFGAVGGPKWDDVNARTRPEAAILALRKKLDVFANLRPVRTYDPLIDSSPVKPHLLKGVDMIIVRELTGGLYFSRPKKRWQTSRGRRGVDTLKYTEQEIERIVRVGFELAQDRRKLLTSADKFNVLESSRLWREIALELAEDYPDVELENVLVDNLAMQLIRNPRRFDVIVTENTFGDIISDEAAVLAGSMGMLPSASLSGRPGRSGSAASSGPALYEPIHGSAPDIAGQGIANPIGAILSVALMLRHSLRLEEEACTVDAAVEAVLAEGYRTPDIAADAGKVVNTVEMGNAIAGRV